MGNSERAAGAALGRKVRRRSAVRCFCMCRFGHMAFEARHVRFCREERESLAQIFLACRWNRAYMTRIIFFGEIMLTAAWDIARTAGISDFPSGFWNTGGKGGT